MAEAAASVEPDNEEENIDNRSHSNQSKVTTTQQTTTEDGASRSVSQTRRQTEKNVRTTETHSENIQGLDDLSSCINSIDDHVQAGLQELRSCVANLKKQRFETSEKLKHLSEEFYQVSSQRDLYQSAIEELQQEVSALREQLHNQQQDNIELHRRMQEVQQKNENHLINIAEKQRSKRIAHSAFVRWRKNALGKGLGCQERLRLLEEENDQLRGELLTYQEAAKKAFLRSANALNSEAITLFQDAATRRLGMEEVSSQESQDSSNSSPRSDHQVGGSQNENGGLDNRFNSENKENIGQDGRNEEVHRRTPPSNVRDRQIEVEDCGSESDDRSYIATYGSDPNILNSHQKNRPSTAYGGDPNRLNPHEENHPSAVYGGDPNQLNSHQRNHPSAVYGGDPNRLNSAEVPLGISRNYWQRGHHSNYEYRSNTEFPSYRERPPDAIRNSSSFTDGVDVGRRVPSRNILINPSTFDPNALQQETRAYLQQLQEERKKGPERTQTTGFESLRKTRKTDSSHIEPQRKMCSCKSRGATAVKVPYKCPYCTPIQNSNFGHARDAPKRNSNASRPSVLPSTSQHNKKVLYRPSASTIVIEKHITK